MLYEDTAGGRSPEKCMAAINEANVNAGLDGNDKSGSANIAVSATSEMFNEIAGLNYQFTGATGDDSFTARLAADHVKAVDLTPPSQYEQGRR